MKKLLQNKRFLFLDRDGVINKRILGGYITRPDELELLDKVADAIAVFNRHFEKVLVVTNQQGIGKGLMTTEDLAAVHQELSHRLWEVNGHIDAFYYCPQLAAVKNNCRKPAPAMGLQAKNEFPEINFSESVMVGDSLSDLQFAKTLGMTAVLIDNPYIATQDKTQADIIVSSLWELAQLIQ